MKTYNYGIDIGGTAVKIGLFDRGGSLIRKWSIPTDTEAKGAHILKAIATSLKAQEEPLDAIYGIGIGVPGPVKDGVVDHAVNLGWERFDVVSTFADLLGEDINISVHNDANLAALGEQAYGAAKTVENAVMITLGTGIGGGIVSAGKIIEGAHGSAGEIGHMKITEQAFPCNCGQTGCLETVASATGVKRIAKQLIAETTLPSRLRQDEDFTAKFVFTQAKYGDELALKVVDAVTLYLAKACQILSVITNPDIIVLGGGMSQAGDFLIDKIKAHFETLTFPAVKETTFKLAELGNDAGIYGAVRAVMMHD